MFLAALMLAGVLAAQSEWTALPISLPVLALPECTFHFLKKNNTFITIILSWLTKLAKFQILSPLICLLWSFQPHHTIFTVYQGDIEL